MSNFPEDPKPHFGSKELKPSKIPPRKKAISPQEISKAVKLIRQNRKISEKLLARENYENPCE